MKPLTEDQKRKLNTDIAQKLGWRILTMREAVAEGLYRPHESRDVDAWQQLYNPQNQKIAGAAIRDKAWDNWAWLVPQFCSSLEDCHVMREGMSEVDRSRFANALLDSCTEVTEEVMSIGFELAMDAWELFKVLHSSAEQQALAAAKIWDINLGSFDESA